MQNPLAAFPLLYKTLFALVVTSLSAGVWAHAHLISATPAPESVLSVVPTTLQLFFSEAVESDFSAVRLFDSDGREVQTGHLATAKDDRKVLIVPLSAKLQSGVYRVRWKVVSVDTHKIEGSFTFFVK